jgi:Raf kinase inhibitor-like YbhB/YbcL family protein
MMKHIARTIAGAMTVALIAAPGVASLLAQAPTGGAQAPAGRAGAPPNPPLLMTTTAFQDGGVIPDKYTQVAGPAAVSPALSWSQVPPGTQSFVLLMHDPEPVLNKTSKMDITHWLVWNIPATSTGLPENVPAGELPDGTRQVSLRSNAYMGPGAPPGPYHHYTFELYALDIKLEVPQGQPTAAAATRNAVIDAMDGHVLGKAILVGRFHRP